jgi:aldehyde dehydrogenase (NAD+)
MVIAQEETFGPVLCVIGYDDEDDAVRIANDSLYGLSGGVYSGSDERAGNLARRVRTGSMSVNGAGSGIGRQNGLEGFEQGR